MLKRFMQLASVGCLLVASGPSFSSPVYSVTVPVKSISERYVYAVKKIPEEECYRVRVKGGSGGNSHTPELLGAIIGGSLANELDDSDTSKVAGALLGASIGRDLENKNKRNSGSSRTELRCETVYRNAEVRENDGYDVSYEYKGRLYTSALDYRPGSTIDLDVFVAPVESSSHAVTATVPVLGYSTRFSTVIEKVPEEECRRVQVSGGGGGNSHTPELLGAIIGGSLANELDDSDASKVAGALLGASIGRDLEKKNQRNSGSSRTELRCETVYKNREVREITGYSVRYEYKGNELTSIVQRRPGAQIDLYEYALPEGART